jgi:carboxypeptidase C (cathepsin A)
MTLPTLAKKFHSSLFALLVAVATTTALAQENPHQTTPAEQQAAPQDQRRGSAQERPAPEQSVLRLLPADAVSQHTINTASGKLDYTATAGTLSLFDQSGQRSAAIFYTAYTVKSADLARRPVTFVFNGGPGAASAFLNLGLVGPRIAEFGPANRDASATRLADNPDTWLPFTDLVLIDPVGSGWSKPAKPDGGQAFWGVRRDADSLAKTIALYVSKNARSASPKYILGESYGGFRAAKVAQALRRDQGIAISGIVMVSPLLEGHFTFGGTRFALGAALQLPSLAASELERKGMFSKERLAEAERFAINEYLPMLAGRPPEGEAGKTFYAKVAEMSGLPLDVVTKSRGFIRDAYVKNLRSAERKIVSRYDATYAVVVRAYGGAFAAYARDELGFKTEMTYVLLAGDVSGKWDWEGGRANASVSEDMREMLAVEPTFRLLIAHGYSDMVTPYAASRYVLDHLPAIGDPARAQLKLYRGGHMFYLDAESRRGFSADARAFYQEP